MINHAHEATNLRSSSSKSVLRTADQTLFCVNTYQHKQKNAPSSNLYYSEINSLKLFFY